MIQSLDDLVNELCGIRLGENATLFHKVSEVLTLYLFHNYIDVFLVLECFNLGHNKGMIKLEEDLHLLVHLSDHAFAHPLSRNDLNSILHILIALIFS